jgi:hypothetical protein
MPGDLASYRAVIGSPSSNDNSTRFPNAISDPYSGRFVDDLAGVATRRGRRFLGGRLLRRRR